MQRTVAAARAEEESVSRLLADHLSAGEATPPIARGSWPVYDQVNVQTGLDAWLAEPGREHQLVGLTGFRNRDFGLADLLQGGSQPWVPPGVGSVATEALPAGPPAIEREQVILPHELLDGIERQVLGVARHAGRLRASGQHLRRGVLLYGVPAAAKTHTIRYLLGQLPDTTVVLQPSVVVVEDVHLIAEERDHHLGENPLLFELLNEMDGLSADNDVTFLLMTNRADLL
jgi:ATPase family protein associated with various cellular activities (AAA)